MNFADPSGLSQSGHPLKGSSTLAGPQLGLYAAPAKTSGAAPRPASTFAGVTVEYASSSHPAGVSYASASRALQGMRAIEQELARRENEAIWAAARPLLAASTANWRPQSTAGPVNRALGAAGAAVRGAGESLGGGIEYVASGYGGTGGNMVAGIGGGLAQLVRTAGNIGGSIVDVPRTFEAGLEDVRQTVRTGQQYGVLTGAARQIGLLQGAEAYYGTDVMTYQQVDVVGKTSEAFGRLGATAAAGAGVGRLLSPKLEVLETPMQIVSRVAQKQADKGLPHLGKSLSAPERSAFVSSPALGPKFLGQAVHRATAAELRAVYGTRFQYQAVGPDFLDALTGQFIELTTPGQVGAHVAKGGAYTGAGYATYVLPKYP